MSVEEIRAKTVKIAVTGVGTAAGPVYRITERVSQRSRKKGTPEDEWTAYENALLSVKEKMKRNKSGDMADVMETYVMFLEDPDLLGTARRAVWDEGLGAAEAAEKAGKHGAGMFSSVEDEYIRSRSDDVLAAFSFLAREIDENNEEEKMTCPSVIVGEALMPTDLSGIEPENILAVVTGKGNKTSHLAILTRGMGIPCITCADPCVMALRTGEPVIVDTDLGEITVDPAPKAFREAEEKMRERLLRMRKTEESFPERPLPIKIYANIGSPSDLSSVKKYGAEGIGLFRSEFLFLGRDSAPDEEEQFIAYKTVVEGMEGKPVIIRTSDLGTDKMPLYMKKAQEENPALGKRAIRLSLADPESFRVQLRALLRAACYGNEKIMYPMITSVSEVKLLRAQLLLAAEELNTRGENYRIPPAGIMIETPAAAMISDILAREVDFFSIGTNDLTQYTLAIDRQGEGLDDYYDSHHEAVLRLIEKSAESAHRAGIEIGICGELGADATLYGRFLAAGIDELSMSPTAIPDARRALSEFVRNFGKAHETVEEENGKTGPILVSPADGTLISMEEIPDPVFASGTMGKCFGVVPDNGLIYAPAGGEIENIAATKHAFTIRTPSGNHILVHVGIDTVNLKGEGFSVIRGEGQTVSSGDPVLRADLALIRKAGYQTMVITALLKQ